MKTVLFAALGAITLLSNAVTAHADYTDGKSYPGSMCKPIRGDGAMVRSFSMLSNESTTSALQVQCPAVKDGPDIKSAWVRVKDQHPSEDVQCKVFVARTSGTSLSAWQSALEPTEGSSNTWKTLSFGGLPANGVSHYALWCSVPPRTNIGRSSIATYQITENI